MVFLSYRSQNLINNWLRSFYEQNKTSFIIVSSLVVAFVILSTVIILLKVKVRGKPPVRKIDKFVFNPNNYNQIKFRNDPVVYNMPIEIYDIREKTEEKVQQAILLEREQMTASKPVKTIEEWLYDERAVIEDLLEQDKDLFAYIERAIRKTIDKNHIAALEKIRQELQDEAKNRDDDEEEDHGDTAFVESIDENLTETERKRARERERKALDERAAYIESKKKGADVPLPMSRLYMTREEIIDYIDDLDSTAHPIAASIRFRKKDMLPDIIKCGPWVFALMYEKKGVLKLVLRIDDNTARLLSTMHTGIKKSQSLSGDNWYDAVIDLSYVFKSEVFDLLEKAYLFVSRKYFNYAPAQKLYITDEDEAQKDFINIEAEIAANIRTIDAYYDEAIRETIIAQERYRQLYGNVFRVKRSRLIKYFRKYLPEGAEIIEREQFFRPTSLVYKDKVFALVYQRGGWAKVIIRCSAAYAQKLEKLHPVVYRARFPKGKNWYCVLLETSFRSTNSAYRVLVNAYKFVKGKPKKIKSSPSSKIPIEHKDIKKEHTLLGA